MSRRVEWVTVLPLLFDILSFTDVGREGAVFVPALEMVRPPSRTEGVQDTRDDTRLRGCPKTREGSNIFDRPSHGVGRVGSGRGSGGTGTTPSFKIGCSLET